MLLIGFSFFLIGCDDGNDYIPATNDSNSSTASEVNSQSTHEQSSIDINDVDEDDPINEPSKDDEDQPSSTSNNQTPTNGDTYDDDISWGPLHK